MALSDNRAPDSADAASLMSAEANLLPATIRVSTLPNGFRIATDCMPGIETATVGIWTSCGARNETPAENGVAHLLEHMLFKGTLRRTAQGFF